MWNYLGLQDEGKGEKCAPELRHRERENTDLEKVVSPVSIAISSTPRFWRSPELDL